MLHFVAFGHHRLTAIQAIRDADHPSISISMTTVSTLLPPSPSNVKLIITDVDGTLLDSKHQIHPRTLSAFRALRHAHPDLPIVIASGKQYHSCRHIREQLQLPPQFPAAHCNGCLIYGGPEGQLIRENGLDPDAVDYILEKSSRFGTFLFTHSSAILVHTGQGVNQKDWCAIAGAYDSGIEDWTGDQDKVQDLLAKVRAGETTIAKITMCADESDLKSKRFALSLDLSHLICDHL